MPHYLSVAAASALILTATSSSASAKPTDGYLLRGVEKGAIVGKALSTQITAPKSNIFFILRKPLTQMKTFYCGILHPKMNPTTEVYFTAVFDWDKPGDEVTMSVDSESDGHEYQSCRQLDMDMP